MKAHTALLMQALVEGTTFKEQQFILTLLLLIRENIKTELEESSTLGSSDLESTSASQQKKVNNSIEIFQ